MNSFKDKDMFLSMAFVLLFAIFAAGCAIMRPSERTAAFKEADQDQNNVLSREELNQYLARLLLERVDLDGDGIITRDEWRNAHSGADAGKVFADLDENKDGRLTRGEVLRAIARTGDLEVVLMNLDQDRNGAVTPDELERRPVSGLLQIRF